MCLPRIASVSTLYKDRYMDARTLVNHVIIERVLSEKNKQSRQRFAGLIDWTAVLNSAVSPKSPPPIPDLLLKNARVCVGDFGILRAGPHKIIKPAEKDKSEPRPDPTEGDQPSSLFENTDHFVDPKDSKKKPTSDPKPVIKSVLIRKLLP